MIEDKASRPRPTPRDWAVFRYGLISEATRPRDGQPASQILAKISARQHQLPDGSLRRYAVATLRLWLQRYLAEGLDSLMPKARSDKGAFRAIDDDTAETIARFRVQHRQVSVKLFHQMLHEDGVLGGNTICEATLRRFLHARGLAKALRSPDRARAKYEMPHPNDLWVADFMHGPQLGTKKHKRRAILCAIIDDHSRVIVGGRFAHGEDTAELLHTFRDAIATYGVPKRFYCDNGPAFVSRHLAEACARIGCTLLHSEPFDSPSRGKIERFFRTVRGRFLSRLAESDLVSIETIQQRFEDWLREDYHLKRHGGIGVKPLDRFLAGAEETLISRLAPQEIDHAFMARLTRVVRKDATVKIQSAFYELPPEFIGARVDIRYPVGRPNELFLYQDDKPVTPIKLVDLVDNARFHAHKVELSYADVVEKRPQGDPQ